MTRTSLVVFLLALSAPAFAQSDPHAQSPDAQSPHAQSPHGPNPHGTDDADAVRRALAGISTAQAGPDPSVPPGQIVVGVVGLTGAPLAGVDVRLGSMGAGGARDADHGETDAAGRVVFAGLEPGGSTAYRVSVDHQGARYAATPFRLEEGQGHRVLLRRLDTSSNPNLLLQMRGRMMLEYQKDSVRITQESQLTNLGQETYVFPPAREGDPGGLLVPLPEGFHDFQTQQVMTDQRISETPEGFRISGSIPPGSVTLLWAYEVPRSGGEWRARIDNPFRTFQFQVISEASEGMHLDVEGFAPAQTHEGAGVRFLQAQTVRQPTDPLLQSIAVEVKGIPHEGPTRWIAVGLMGVLLLLAVALMARKGDARYYFASLRNARRDELLAEAASLHAEFEAGEVGPEFHARRLREITDELAGLLQVQELER